MAESLESRKHERKSTFDVPLPMRRKDLQTITSVDGAEEPTPVPPPGNTMAFSLLTKRGNRQQVSYSIPLVRPSLISISDPYCRIAFRFHLCSRHEDSASS